MNLTALNPHFLKISRSQDNTGIYWDRVPTLAEADGIIFSCPKCKDKLNAAGIHMDHSLTAWKPGTDPGIPGRARWHMTGTGYTDLTLTPSIMIVGGCSWHGYVTNGMIVNC